MKLAYEIVNETARIWRCYTYGNEAEIPAKIDGYPVTELAPYVFSSHMDEKKLESGQKDGSILLWGEEETSAFTTVEEVPVLKGSRLRALYFPETLRKIGAYAFYNCNALEELYFYGGLRDLGAGLFTGCHHIRHLEVTLQKERVSCLQDILMEIPEKMQVVFHGIEEAWVLFPEFFEEGTENTPARNLSSTMHGSGMNYRNCFYRKCLDYRAYDSKFYWAIVNEDFDTVLDMVQQRLRFPVELSGEARGIYESWLREYLQEAARKLVQRHDMAGMIWLVETYILPDFTAKKPWGGTDAREVCGGGMDTQGIFRSMTEAAVTCGFSEGAAYLLDMSHKLFKPKVRKFEL